MITNIDRIDDLVMKAYADGYEAGAGKMLDFIVDTGLMNNKTKELYLSQMDLTDSMWDKYMDDHYARFKVQQIRNAIMESMGNVMRQRSEEGRTYGGYVEINDEMNLKGI